MSGKKKVLKSVNFQDGGRCVDIFMRPEGTFGFEEYRRDIEDDRGWFPIGFFGHRVFDSEEKAINDALAKISWLKAAIICS